tara:strand:+ start:3993 stop:4742 length:750 start_codon:yes stop_codon:yes gene_type:complete
MKKNVWSKDGKRTVDMYPNNLKEAIFKYNKKYNKKYIWPEERLFSPSRVLDQTSDKSFLEAWRKKVGEEEANRIVQYSIAVGKSMHSYLETSIKKMSHISHTKLPPSTETSDKKIEKLSMSLGNIILEKGLKNKLQEVWGVESRLHFGNYYRGIADLIGIYEDEPCIIDFKQKRKPQMEHYDSIKNYFTQTAAYGMAHNHMCKTNIKKGVILIATHDYKFQKFIIQGDAWRKHCLNFIKRLKTCMKEDQ